MHYPTDSNLLLDAMRKSLFLSSDLCIKYDISDLRQYKYNFKQLKYALRAIQKANRGRVNLEKKIVIYKEYMTLAQKQLAKIATVLTDIEQIPTLSTIDIVIMEEIRGYMDHVRRQLDHIERRVIHGEVIPHGEKVFSIFEPHTEWVSKGKAGVPVELGVRVCILEDQHQFILHHRIMEHETDSTVAVKMVESSQKKFPQLSSASFDKGFHSQENQELLSDMLDLAALPRKGRLSKANKEIESRDEFRKARKQHPAVESAINALEVHGLDRCRDHGIDGFKRYVALAVVTRNIHRIGDVLHKREQKILERQARRLKAANSGQFRLIA